MRTIKLKYTDYYDGFDPREHVLVKLLEKHYKIEWSDDPDYLIYGVFGDDNIRYNDCVKIFYTGEDLCPDFFLDFPLNINIEASECESQQLTFRAGRAGTQKIKPDSSILDFIDI